MSLASLAFDIERMANTAIDDVKRETDEDNITRRLNKAFESRLDLDRVGFETFVYYNCSESIIVLIKWLDLI